MRLTNFSDYALRLLMYAAAHRDRLVTIEETSEAYGISRTHLMKIANMLTELVIRNPYAAARAASHWPSGQKRSDWVTSCG
jgi:hypothetical protein